MLIYDVNNWVRVKMAESLGGASIFSLWQEVLANSIAGKKQIFISDGFDSRKLRREIYPEYKAQRKPADQSIYDGINFFKELLFDAPTNILYGEVSGYEADDVIANLAVKYREAMVKGELTPENIDIITTDQDMSQLRLIDGVSTLTDPKIEPKWVKLFKMMVGDPSDNLKGIKGFGKKSWEQLSADFKDRMTVLFHYYPRSIEGMPLDYIEKLCDKNMSFGNLCAFMTALKNGDLHKYYRLVSFYKVPNEKMILNCGSGRVEVANAKVCQFNL